MYILVRFTSYETRTRRGPADDVCCGYARRHLKLPVCMGDWTHPLVCRMSYEARTGHGPADDVCYG
jgi:hypothetical protein